MNAATDRVAPLLVCKRIEIAGDGGRKLVNDVSFSVDRGSVTALVGESGSGKTLLAKAVLGLLPPGIALSRGRIDLDGEDLTRSSPSRLRAIRGRQIGMIFQEPMVSLNPALRIGTQMVEALQHHLGTSAVDALAQAQTMLERVQIPRPEQCLTAYPHEFSGGMRQRIMIASVMLMRPKLLIADEPTTALDTLSQRGVIDLVTDLTRELGSAMLLITHDLGLVRRYASNVVVLRQGRFIECGPCKELFEAPKQPYTAQLITALPQPRYRSPPLRHDPPVVEALEVSVVYEGRRSPFRSSKPVHAVRQVSFSIHRGETLAIVGGSGSGKTTLAHAALGSLPYSDGVIRFREQDIRKLDAKGRRDFRTACGIVFQDPYSSLDPRFTIAETVAEPLVHVPGLSRQQKIERVTDALAEVGLEGFERRFPHQLSGGQRQRVAIARAIIGKPAFIVADEPVSALDVTIQRQILELFTTLQQRHGFACLLISHDLGAVARIADRIMVMKDGRTVEHGDCRAILEHPTEAFTRALIEASPYSFNVPPESRYAV